MASTLGVHNPLRYRGYVYDPETALYYLQSRYYDPDVGRFINADSLVDTRSLVGHNMFAYCWNNPAMYVDPSGNIPFADNFFAEDYMKIGNLIYDEINKIIDAERTKAKKLRYVSNSDNNGGHIEDSHTIKNPIVMYEFVEERRGEEISGSTAGVVIEWVVHNVAHGIGKVLNSLGAETTGDNLMKRGKDLDIGSTIYDDNHGALSFCMWGVYLVLSPFTALYDIAVEVFE